MIDKRSHVINQSFLFLIRVNLRSSAAAFTVVANLHFLSLLLRSSLDPRLIASVPTPNAVERAVGPDLICDEPAAHAADADRDVVAALNADAVSVVAPDKPMSISSWFDCQVYFVGRAIRVLPNCFVIANQV